MHPGAAMDVEVVGQKLAHRRASARVIDGRRVDGPVSLRPARGARRKVSEAVSFCLTSHPIVLETMNASGQTATAPARSAKFPVRRTPTSQRFNDDRWNPHRTIPAMVEQIYEFLTLIFRKGPEFIAIGFLGLVGGVALTSFGPRWLRRLLLPQMIDSSERKIAKLEQEVDELKQVADQTKAANADLARDKETFQLTIAAPIGPH